MHWQELTEWAVNIFGKQREAIADLNPYGAETRLNLTQANLPLNGACSWMPS
ncbi:hypothetical protein [Phormidium sp. CCY1219]|uniref:hypothetical protein n=1 Tax=Phormidium sp. CCY1219 TaxID=2886104 RepID=UPI002D1EE2A3|nr:hypothetical protein [Phormidium sp. CCY1219]MEB3830572.1 hypothetical protein [Phormidium sp. CCY1219]